MSSLTMKQVIDVVVKKMVSVDSNGDCLRLPLLLMVVAHDESATVMRVAKDGTIKVVAPTLDPIREPGDKLHFVGCGKDQNGKLGVRLQELELTQELHEMVRVTFHRLTSAPGTVIE